MEARVGFLKRRRGSGGVGRDSSRSSTEVLGDNFAFVDRRFEILYYHKGHKWLLLRGIAEPRAPFGNRVDLLFVDTYAMHLPTRQMDGLTVSIADPATDQQIIGEAGVVLGPAETPKTYRLHTGPFEGYVVAGAAFWIDEVGREFDPSPFDVDPAFREFTTLTLLGDAVESDRLPWRRQVGGDVDQEDPPPGWYFTVAEVSPGVWEARGMDGRGHNVSRQGRDAGLVTRDFWAIVRWIDGDGPKTG